MTERELDFILKEHFDTSDRRTVRTILSLNEADQNQAMIALASKLYEKIVAKVDDIDFGTIPVSKGDITKIGNFNEMRDCMNIIRDILVHYKQDTKQLDIVDKAVENIKATKSIWEKAYIVNSELPITFYETVCLSIVSSISLLISASIDFIKEPGRSSFTVSFDHAGYAKTKDKLLFKNLERFNDSCLKGDLQKLMKSVVNSTANIRESAMEPIQESLSLVTILSFIGTGIMVITLLKLVIPVLHELTCFLYCTRQNVADYFEAQAKIVQFNAEQLKYDYTKSEDEIKKIYDKQSKIAKLFKTIGDKLAIKMTKSEKDAKAMIQKENNEKVKVDDLEVQDAPGVTSSLF